MNNMLMCFCCSIFNALIYTVCANLQWILYANESGEVSCLKDVALAAALLSSLATLFKLISASYSACLVSNNTSRSKTAVIFDYWLKFLQLFLKYAALACTVVYLTATRIVRDPCGGTTEGHQELPPLSPLIITVLSLESIGSIIETTSLIYDICCMCQQRKTKSGEKSDHEQGTAVVEEM